MATHLIWEVGHLPALSGSHLAGEGEAARIQLCTEKGHSSLVALLPLGQPHASFRAWSYTAGPVLIAMGELVTHPGLLRLEHREPLGCRLISGKLRSGRPGRRAALDETLTRAVEAEERFVLITRLVQGSFWLISWRSVDVCLWSGRGTTCIRFTTAQAEYCVRSGSQLTSRASLVVETFRQRLEPSGSIRGSCHRLDGCVRA